MSLPADYPRCKTCKHLEPLKYGNGFNGHCRRIVETENFDNPGDKIFDEEYDHAVVGLGFGCLHHSDLSPTVPSDSQER